MSISAGLSNMFTDVFHLIEANLTPFEINNLRIVMKRSLLDLSLCTVDQIVRGIKDGVDFCDLPAFIHDMKQKDFNIYGYLRQCKDTIEKRGESCGYKWLCLVYDAYPGEYNGLGFLMKCLLFVDNITEINYALTKQIVTKFLESKHRYYHILIRLTLSELLITANSHHCRNKPNNHATIKHIDHLICSVRNYGL